MNFQNFKEPETGCSTPADPKEKHPSETLPIASKNNRNSTFQREPIEGLEPTTC